MRPGALGGWAPILLLRACRPRQWVKNVLVAAAPAAAGILTHPDVAGKVVAAFVCFCALSSATYLLNDVHDRHEDCHDSRRRSRPIAAGQLSVRAAVVAALLLAVGGLALAAAVRPALAAVGGGYLALTATYTLWLRAIAVADIAAVAGGFVLRALAGGAATAVPLSRWFLLVTSFGALFLVAGKRYAELTGGGRCDPSDRDGKDSQVNSQGVVKTGGGRGDQPNPDGRSIREPLASPTPPNQPVALRPSLQAYSERYLRFVLGLTAAVATTGYCLWAFQRAHTAKLSWYELTVIPFVLWLLRYALLIDGGEGQAPEELVLRDGFLLSMSAAWLALFVVGVYVAG